MDQNFRNLIWECHPYCPTLVNPIIGVRAPSATADDPCNSKTLLVLEYAEGGPLFDGPRLLRSRKLTEVFAHKYFRDILQACAPPPPPLSSSPHLYHVHVVV